MKRGEATVFGFHESRDPTLEGGNEITGRGKKVLRPRIAVYMAASSRVSERYYLAVYRVTRAQGKARN